MNPSHYSNGLPYKPVVYPMSHDLLFLEEEQINGLCVYMADDVLKELGAFQISTVDLEDGELWVSVNDTYVVVPNLSEKTLECINEKKLLISFFDSKVKTVMGLKIS